MRRSYTKQMTEERKNRFNFEPAGVIVTPADGGAPYRADGKPLTDFDREILAGRDPLANVLPQAE